MTTVTTHTLAQDVGQECSIKLPAIHFTSCLNGAQHNAVVQGERVTLKSGARKDYFNDPDGKLSNNTAPVLLAQVDNSKPFTLTAKVTPEFKAKYDAGALYLFASEQLWQKFAFELDERGVTRIVSVRTIGTSDDNNHQSLAQPAAYLKISSDTRTVGLYYSADKLQWHLARLYKNDFPAQLRVGVSAQSPVGEGSASTFEQVSLRQESVKDFRLGL
ncbi:MAG: DUF1349 domain-containing protein [Duganella sp.]